MDKALTKKQLYNQFCDIIAYFCTDLSSAKFELAKLRDIIAGDRAANNLLDKFAKEIITAFSNSFEWDDIKGLLTSTNTDLKQSLNAPRTIINDASSYLAHLSNLRSSFMALNLILLTEDCMVKLQEGDIDGYAKMLNEHISSVSSSGVPIYSGEEWYEKIVAETLTGLQGRISTGFDFLDSFGVANGERGIGRGEIWVLSAPPKTGKTRLALEIAHKAAVSGKNVYFLSTEMSPYAVHQGLIQLAQGVSPNYAEGILTKNEQPDVAIASTQNVHFVDLTRSTITPELLLSTVARLETAEDRPDLIIIDHFHNVVFNTKGNIYNEQNVFMRKLTPLAAHLQSGVLLLAQLAKSNYGEEGINIEKGSSGIRENATLGVFMRNAQDGKGIDITVDYSRRVMPDYNSTMFIRDMVGNHREVTGMRSNK